jgi:AraC-like DNA-binding protein
MAGGQGFVAAQGLARFARAPAARTEWPFVSGIVAGPGGTVAVRRLGDMAILELAGRPVLRSQPRPGGPARAQRLMLLTLIRGEASFRAFDGRLRAVRPGEVMVMDSDLSLDVRGEEGALLVGVTLPLHLITPRFVSRERIRGGTVRTHSGGVAQLVHQLLSGLMSHGRAAPGAGALADALGGLVSAMLEDCWAAEKDEGLAKRKARLEQIGQHIRRNFADPELSPGAVAEALGLSRRYVHKLYAQEGRSFRQDLVGLRIEACLKAFQDDKQVGKTIAEIAFAAGYTDISQFNRHFRRLKGATPSDIRGALAARGVKPRKPARARAKPPLRRLNGKVAGLAGA